MAGASGSPSTGRTGCGPPARSTSAAASRRPSAGRRLYPIQVAEKGYAVYRIARPRNVGPRLDAARRQRGGPGRRAVIQRLAVPGPTARSRRSCAGSWTAAAAALPRRRRPDPARTGGDDPARAEAALARALRPDARPRPAGARCATRSARTSSTPASSTTSSRAMPMVEVDCRVLPGTTEPDMRARSSRRLGPSSRPRARSS